MLYNRQAAPVNDGQVTMGTVGGKHIYNTSYVGFGPQELQPPDPDYSGERERAQAKNSKEGVQPMTPEELNDERTLDWQLVKKFTMNIFKCDFTSFSFPVGFSEPRSFLERTADLFTFLAFPYADKAYQCPDPSKRLALMATGIIAGFHIYLQSKKPWNPVLGETYVGKWPNGTEIFAEQTSHHPAISDFQIIGKHYKCNAHCHFTIASGVRQVDVLQHGVFHLEFDDGSVYEWEFPMISVYGIIWGDRYVKVVGQFVIRDLTNKLICDVQIAPKGNKSKFYYTALAGGIRNENEQTFQSIISGDYTQQVIYDDEVLWEINTDLGERPLTQVDADEILPSDCRFRLDRLFLILGDINESGNAKGIIEESQRREEKLRISIPKQEG